ncbi:MAG: META domain-containing protein [Vicinamibacterales bacterium]
MLCWSASLDATQKISLENTTWSLTRLAARALDKKEHSPGLRLDEKERRAFGFAGCNEFSARYRLSRSTITFERITYTRKRCVDPYLTTVEDEYLAALKRVRSWRVQGTTLSCATPPAARF